MRVAKRLQLDGASAHTLRVVIENHLLMASISQRRDLDDSLVIRNFAGVIQSPENLALLMLHTFADTLGTSDKLWNGFKDALLWLLYRKTLSLFEGSTEFVRAAEKQRGLLMDEVRRALPSDFDDEELLAHFGALPARYFQVQSSREIIDDLELAHEFMQLQLSDEKNPFTPVVHWRNEPDCGYTAVKICTWDRPGLFSKIAGTFSAVGLNILSAKIFTRSDGIALDTLFAADARTGTIPDIEVRGQFEHLLKPVLADDGVNLPEMIARQKISRPFYQAYVGERIPTRIHFDNEASETRTLIEVETEDRVGLLYSISQVFTELQVDIVAAKIFTEKGAAIDTFYVREEDGTKILSLERQHIIDLKLNQAIRKLDSV